MNLKQDDRELLLNFLCMKLPFGAMCLVEGDNNTGTPRKLIRIEVDETDGVLLDFLTDREDKRPIQVYLSEVIPCVKPMSSMTKEDKEDLAVVLGVDYIDNKVVDFGEFLCEGSPVNIEDVYGLLDWLNAHHFDYRGLIPMGLAIEITEENNPYK